MTQLKQIYKCNICGNIVEVLHAGQGQLVCCGQPMELLTEKTQDLGFEKHVPVIEKTEQAMRASSSSSPFASLGQGILVKVGSIPHPMEEAHYIEWIEVIVDGKYGRKFLKPGDKPEALFEVTAKEVVAREYCNLHGLWRS